MSVDPDDLANAVRNNDTVMTRTLISQARIHSAEERVDIFENGLIHFGIPGLGLATMAGQALGLIPKSLETSESQQLVYRALQDAIGDMPTNQKAALQRKYPANYEDWRQGRAH